MVSKRKNLEITTINEKNAHYYYIQYYYIY